MKRTGISNCATRRLSGPPRGFSLTELAIVLGVMGIILGSIWVFADQAWENGRQQQVKGEISNVVKNIRAFYAGQNGISGNFSALTPNLAAPNSQNPPQIPTDMVRIGAPCSNASNSGQMVCADHPWGSSTAATTGTGTFGVCAWAGGCANFLSQFFAIELRELSQASCIKVSMLNSGADAPSGLYDVVINGTSIVSGGSVTPQLPPLASDAGKLCKNAANTIDFVFRLVAPQS